MKEKIVSGLIIMMIIFMSSFNVVSYALENNEDEIVFFKDPNFKEYLMQYDQNNDGELSAKEMESIEEIWLGDQSISNLQGIEYAVNLKSFTWTNDEVYANKNITALSGLTSLTYLNLSDNNISDISVLSDLTSLTVLYLENNNISDIESLSNLTSLEYLDLSNNKNISDISALSSLTSLIELDLSNNRISDISALSDLTNLTSLKLWDNTISDINVLSGLTSLTDLSLWGNNISDISALSNLTSLTDLDISSNQITDISPIENIQTSCEINANYQRFFINIGEVFRNSKIEYELPLIISQIFSYKSIFKGYYRLEELNDDKSYVNEDKTKITIDTSNTGEKNVEFSIVDTSGNSVLNFTINYEVMEYGDKTKEIEFKDENLKRILLEKYDMDSDQKITEYDMKNIYSLELDNSNIQDLSGLEYATNLIHLDLNSNSITDISALSGLTSLTFLNLNWNNITDISALSKLTSLTYLDVSTNNINDISTLSKLTSLTFLDISSNNIEDISELSGLTSLTSLYIINDNIKDINVLSGLTSLMTLNISSNSIEDISTLSKLTSLTSLDISSNIIEDISALSELTLLTSLDISFNNVKDISALSELSSLTYLEFKEQKITLNLGNIPYNSITEVNLPNIFTQYTMRYPGGQIKIIEENVYLGNETKKVTLNTKKLGTNIINIQVQDRWDSIVNFEITYNVLPQKGDINGDGKINTKDWNRMYEYINETVEFSEDELITADINGDGKVNIKDWNRMYEHITEENPLY